MESPVATHRSAPSTPQGVYTAPAVVPNPNLVVVQATSVDNPNSTMIVNVQVMNPVPILLSATPTQLNIGSSTVVLERQSFINGATVLANGVSDPDAIHLVNQLTATVDPSVAGPFDLQVLNPNPGRRRFGRRGRAGGGNAANAAGASRRMLPAS